MTDEVLTAVQCRVLGCLVEKEKATPQNYPLTLNSLRLACNQTTNRFPIVDYDEASIEQALLAMREAGLTRNVYSTSNRATKYRHVLGEAWGLPDDGQAVLAVLLLRGAQTVGEIKGRIERLADLPDLGAVEQVLRDLAGRERPLVRLLERQPGQKDARWVHLLGGDDLAAELASAAASGLTPVAAATATSSAVAADVDRLSDEVARLRDEVAGLRAELDAFRAEFG